MTMLQLNLSGSDERDVNRWNILMNGGSGDGGSWGEGVGATKLNWLMYIMEMCVHVCEFASPWSGSRLNNQIFDLGLEGRFNPRNGEKVFSQVAFMQFRLLEQFYRNVSLQFQHRGQD